MSPQDPRPSTDPSMSDDVEEAMLDPAEVGEEIPSDTDEPMNSDADDDGIPDADEDEPFELHNDSVAHFDGHKDSIFCIAQHPTHPEIVATGGGDDVGYLFDTTTVEAPVLPDSYRTVPPDQTPQTLSSLYQLDGHTDSLNAVTFTLPEGHYILSAGLDGRIRAHRDAASDHSGRNWTFLAEAQEVEEINWLLSCPHPANPNVVALGANDGSVWVYSINAEDTASPLTIVQAFYLHTESCTAGAWTPDGKLLATVSEDGSFYVWDVFGEAAAPGTGDGGQAVVSLTAQDQRFAVEGGLFSLAISPTGNFAVVGGAGGNIRSIGLPRIGSDAVDKTGGKGTASKTNAGRRAGKASTSASGGVSQAGQILVSLQAQSDNIESLAFSPAPLTLLAAASVDGSITLFDTAHRYAVRRQIQDAHDDQAVVKVEFVQNSSTGGWLLTSAGMDGVVRRWDTRGGTAAANKGLVGEWRGHRGGGEGGGVLGFVQGGGGGRIITAGDE